ncbi:uncharacterized protein LOC129780370 [Toxorhynchites rutilus septentrionalis]|uniref:uncharacterized protein LOC129780370 n=1 Tax=Toxorhynchites rutilus septentrionalis TaxID=329112 RepID=UPI00247A2A12|nr:uncharacterized protein LOC129780370 [Toxorhynchites rutilus septentrionalis]
MKRFLALVVILSVCGGTVRADFGLNVTIPDLSKETSAAIGQGIISLIKANATIKSAAVQEDPVTLTALVKIVNNVTSPLNRLLGATLSATTDKVSNSSNLFGNLATLVVETRKAIDDALVASNELQWNIHPTLHEEMRENISVIASSLPMLLEALTVINDSVTVNQNCDGSEYPENILNFFTPTVVNGMIYPLRNIGGSITNIASIVTIISKERTTALSLFTLVNNTISAGMRAIVQPNTVFNRTVNDANTALSANANALSNAITQIYSTIISRPNNFNRGDISSLTIYLSDVKSSIESFDGNVSEAFNNLREDVTVALNANIDQTTSTLLEITRTMSSKAYKSDSEFADRCVSKYANQLTQNPIQVNRLSVCLQAESMNFVPSAQLFRVLSEQTRLLAGSGSPALQMRHCTQGLKDCVATYFEYYGNLSRQVDTKLNINRDLLIHEIQTIRNRIGICMAAISADIAESARSVDTKFNACLTNGL